MRRQVSAAQIAGAFVGLVVVAAIVLYLVPSNDYILLPDRAHPVAPLVRVQGAHPAKGPGGIYFVDVFERRASLLESLFPFIHSGATVVPANLIVPPGSNDQQARRADLEQMSVSQRIAAAVALRRLGYNVTAVPDGVVVLALQANSHAVGKLQPDDVIVSLDRKPTPTVDSLHATLAHIRPGAVVKLRVDRGGRKLTLSVQTIADPRDTKHAIIGFSPTRRRTSISRSACTSTPATSAGRPPGSRSRSRCWRRSGRRSTTATASPPPARSALDGSVGAIGGIKQKTFGARAAHADVFLVPSAGDNARDARRYAHGLRIIAVKSFPQALRALATLPRKR